MMHAMNQECK